MRGKAAKKVVKYHRRQNNVCTESSCPRLDAHRAYTVNCLSAETNGGTYRGCQGRRRDATAARKLFSRPSKSHFLLTYVSYVDQNRSIRESYR